MIYEITPYSNKWNISIETAKNDFLNLEMLVIRCLYESFFTNFSRAFLKGIPGKIKERRTHRWK